MKIGGWDIILGVDWMYQFSPTSFDFKQLKIILCNDNESIFLEGMVENPVVRKMKGRTIKQCRQEEWRSKAICNIQIESEVPETLSDLQKEFLDVFESPTILPPERQLDHQIPLKSDSKPFKLKSYINSHFQKSEIEKQVVEMLKNGIIQPSSSLFASPLLLVRKKYGL